MAVAATLQVPIDAEGRVTACRACYGHWQMCSDAVVMGIQKKKIEFSLFVVSVPLSGFGWSK